MLIEGEFEHKLCKHRFRFKVRSGALTRDIRITCMGCGMVGDFEDFVVHTAVTIGDRYKREGEE